MREIEVKARVKNPQDVLAKLQDMGVQMSQPVTQRDEVYGVPGAQDASLSAAWLRVRTENSKRFIFTLKKSIIGHLDSIEHEVEVDNPDELKKIIEQLGFEPYSDLTKTRSKGKVGDIEICLDTVGKLGDFIEAEKIMNHDADHDAVVKELWDLLIKLGIKKSDEEVLGYDVLERQNRANP